MFMLLMCIFEMKESLPIEDTDVKLIVDGQHNEVITEHVGELMDKKLLDKRQNISTELLKWLEIRIYFQFHS